MRTNIDIDDSLMDAALRWSGASTKREAVETALREMVRLRERAHLARELRGALPWEGNLDDMRTDKVR